MTPPEVPRRGKALNPGQVPCRLRIATAAKAGIPWQRLFFVFNEAFDILPLKPPVAAGSDAVGFEHALIRPVPDRVGRHIQMLGYIEDEKLAIAEQYLLKKQMEGHGLADADVKLEEAALRKIIRHHTREAGVRQLERNIGKVVRKLAVQVAAGKNGSFVVVEEDIAEFLGPDKFTYGVAEEKDEVGLATGMAWTHVGGELLAIETVIMSGKGKLTVTGQLGEVMQESAHAALS